MANEDSKVDYGKHLQNFKQTFKPTIWSYLTNVGKWSDIIKLQNKPTKEDVIKVTDITSEEIKNLKESSFNSNEVEIEYDDVLPEPVTFKQKTKVKRFQDESQKVRTSKRTQRNPKTPKQIKSTSRSSSNDELALYTNRTWVQNVSMQELYRHDKKFLIQNFDRTEINVNKNPKDDKCKFVTLLAEKIKKIETQVIGVQPDNALKTGGNSKHKKLVHLNEDPIVVSLKSPPHKTETQTNFGKDKTLENTTTYKEENNVNKEKERRHERKRLKKNLDGTKDNDKIRHAKNKDKETRKQKRSNYRVNEELLASHTKLLKQKKNTNDNIISVTKVNKNTEQENVKKLHNKHNNNINNNNNNNTDTNTTTNNHNLISDLSNEQLSVQYLLNRIRILEDQFKYINKPRRMPCQRISKSTESILSSLNYNNCFNCNNNNINYDMFVSKEKMYKTDEKHRAMKNADYCLESTDEHCVTSGKTLRNSTTTHCSKLTFNVDKQGKLCTHPKKDDFVKTCFLNESDKQDFISKSISDTNILCKKSSSFNNKLTVTKINPYQVEQNCVFRYMNKNARDQGDSLQNEYDSFPTKDNTNNLQFSMMNHQKYKSPKLVRKGIGYEPRKTDSKPEKEITSCMKKGVNDGYEKDYAFPSDDSIKDSNSESALYSKTNLTQNANRYRNQKNSLNSFQLLNRKFQDDDGNDLLGLPFKQKKFFSDMDDDSIVPHSENTSFPATKSYMTAKERRDFESSLRYKPYRQSRPRYQYNEYMVLKSSTQFNKPINTVANEIDEKIMMENQYYCPNQTCMVNTAEYEYKTNFRTTKIDLKLFKRIKNPPANSNEVESIADNNVVIREIEGSSLDVSPARSVDTTCMSEQIANNERENLTDKAFTKNNNSTRNNMSLDFSHTCYKPVGVSSNKQPENFSNGMTSNFKSIDENKMNHTCEQFKDTEKQNFYSKGYTINITEKKSNVRMNVAKSKSANLLLVESGDQNFKSKIKCQSLRNVKGNNSNLGRECLMSTQARRQLLLNKVINEINCRKSKSECHVGSIADRGDCLSNDTIKNNLNLRDSKLPGNNFSDVYLVFVNDSLSCKKIKLNKDSLKEGQFTKIINDLKNNIDELIDRKQELSPEFNSSKYLNKKKNISMNYKAERMESGPKMRSTEKLLIKNKEINKKLKRLKNKEAKFCKHHEKRRKKKSSSSSGEKQVTLFKATRISNVSSSSNNDRNVKFMSHKSEHHKKMKDVSFNEDSDKLKAENDFLACLAKVVDTDFMPKFKSNITNVIDITERKHRKSPIMERKSRQKTKIAESIINCAVENVKNIHLGERHAFADVVPNHIGSQTDTANNKSADNSTLCDCLDTGANCCFPQINLVVFQKSDDSGSDNNNKPIAPQGADQLCLNKNNNDILSEGFSGVLNNKDIDLVSQNKNIDVNRYYNDVLCQKEILELKKQVFLQRKEVNELKAIWLNCSSRLEDIWKKKETSSRMDSSETTSTEFSHTQLKKQEYNISKCLTSTALLKTEERTTKQQKPDMVYAFRSLAESSLFQSEVLSDVGVSCDKKNINPSKKKSKSNLLYDTKERQCVLFRRQKKSKTKHEDADVSVNTRRNKITKQAMKRDKSVSLSSSQCSVLSTSDSSVNDFALDMWKSPNNSTQTASSEDSDEPEFS